MKFLGIHDYTMTAPMFIDPTTSLSWLRAFERLGEDVQPHAYLREKNYDRDVIGKINGIHYHFHTANLNTVWKKIGKEASDLIFFNLCDFASGFEGVAKLRAMLPDCSFVIRLHHEPSHLFQKNRFQEILHAMDLAIVPLPFHAQELRKVGFRGRVEAAPFGVEWNNFAAKAKPFAERTMDVVSAIGPAPQKNTPLMKEVYKILAGRGYKVTNLSGLSKGALSDALANAKIFFQPSMTDASGSRVLLEAVAAGCFPVCVRESTTTSRVVEEFAGKSLDTGITFDSAKGIIHNPEGISLQVADDLEALVKAKSGQDFHRVDESFSQTYSQDREVENLIRILRSAAGSVSPQSSLPNRAYNLILNRLGIDHQEMNDEELEQLAILVCQNPVHRSHNVDIARILCGTVGWLGANWGLQEQLFTRSYNVARSIAWMRAQAR